MVFIAYVIAFCGWLVLGRYLSGRLGDRWVFTAGSAVLISGSIVAAVAQTAWAEVVGRGVQGIGGALITPTAISLLLSLSVRSPEVRGKATAARYGVEALASGVEGVLPGNVYGAAEPAAPLRRLHPVAHRGRCAPAVARRCRPRHHRRSWCRRGQRRARTRCLRRGPRRRHRHGLALRPTRASRRAALRVRCVVMQERA